MSATGLKRARAWSGRFRSPWTRPLLFTAVVGLLLAVQAIGSAIYGNVRTDPQISAQLARQGSADVAVVFDFTPEQFQLTFLQGLGNIIKQSGDTIYMTGVTTSGVRDIAGEYWVGAVLPWNGR